MGESSLDEEEGHSPIVVGLPGRSNTHQNKAWSLSATSTGCSRVSVRSRLHMHGPAPSNDLLLVSQPSADWMAILGCSTRLVTQGRGLRRQPWEVESLPHSHSTVMIAGRLWVLGLANWAASGFLPNRCGTRVGG